MQERRIPQPPTSEYCDYGHTDIAMASGQDGRFECRGFDSDAILVV
jgi:hypothetical protein